MLQSIREHAISHAATPLLLVCGVLGGAPTAFAADAPYSPPGDAGQVLSVMVSGAIAERCELSGGGAVDLGELQGGEEFSAPLGLDCNMPFDIGVRSLRGALAHETQPGGEGPYSGALTYRLSLTIPVVDPLPATLRSSFSSAELVSERTLSSGDAIAAGGASMRVKMDRPAGAGLLAGRYTETVTLTITPKV